MFNHVLENGTTLKYNFLKDKTSHMTIIAGMLITAVVCIAQNKSYRDGLWDAERVYNTNML